MKILVVGEAAEGKSTITRVIENALKASGLYNVKVIDSLDEEESHLNFKLRKWHQEQRIKSLALQHKEIIIETQQLRRSSSNVK